MLPPSSETQQEPNSSLTSLAMLSLNIREGRDYLDYLEGFVFGALNDLGTDPFDAATIKKLVYEKFALQIPVATFAIYLKRLSKSGKIRRTSTGLQYQLQKKPDQILEIEKTKIQSGITTTIDKLALFAYKSYGLSWDERSSGTALVEFLRKYSIDFLRYTEGHSPLPKFEEKPGDFSYVISSFVIYCSKQDLTSFDNIKSLVRSHILSNALMCPDIQKNSTGFKDITFILDTRFLIQALDLESSYETDSAIQLISAVRRLKGTLCIFNETKDELIGVLRAVRRGIQNGEGRGPIYRELIKRGRGIDHIILSEGRLDDNLKELKISTHPSPRYEEEQYKFQIDESQFRAELEDEADYLSERAADHDVRVVRHIYALRRGKRPSSIEDSNFVLLTTNSALSRAAFRYERSNGRGWFFSTVITDYHLSHLAWLKSPMQAPDLTTTELLANCYAAMRPAEAFWNHYVLEIDRLKSENKVSARDHEVLRFSASAPDELMEMTRGQIDGVTPQNINKILKNLEDKFAEDKQSLLNNERSEHKKTQDQLNQANDQIAINENKIKNDKIEKENRTNRRAKKIAKIVFYTVGSAFILISILQYIFNTNIPLGIMLTAIGALNIWSGISGNKIEQYVQKSTAKLLNKVGEWF